MMMTDYLHRSTSWGGGVGGVEGGLMEALH